MATQLNAEVADNLPRTDDLELDERLRAAGVKLATTSLDRPRSPVRLRPRWLAFLLTLVKRPA